MKLWGVAAQRGHLSIWWPFSLWRQCCGPFGRFGRWFLCWHHGILAARQLHQDREVQPRHAPMAMADARRTHQEAHALRRNNRQAQQKARSCFGELTVTVELPGWRLHSQIVGLLNADWCWHSLGCTRTRCCQSGYSVNPVVWFVESLESLESPEVCYWKCQKSYQSLIYKKKSSMCHPTNF